MAGKSINKATLIGNLGKDPEVRYTSGGVAVASFSLATNERWKDQEGNFQDRTQWHSIVAWSNLAEICGNYLKKGSKIYLEGRIQYRTYDDKNGVKRNVTEVVMNDLVMLDSKPSGGRAEPDSGGGADPDSGGTQDQGPAENPPSTDDLPF